MYLLVFLLCVHMEHLSEHSCEVYELLTPKEYIQLNKDELKKYAKNNNKHVSLFTIREW